MHSIDNRSTLTRSITRALQGIAVATPLLLGAASAHAASCPSVNAPSLDARLAASADQGSDALRRFVQRTTTIYQLDYWTAQARAERFHRDSARCAIQTASR